MIRNAAVITSVVILCSLRASLGGVEFIPTSISLPSLQQGENRNLTLNIINDGNEDIVIGKAVATCGCTILTDSSFVLKANADYQIIASIRGPKKAGTTIRVILYTEGMTEAASFLIRLREDAETLPENGSVGEKPIEKSLKWTRLTTEEWRVVKVPTSHFSGLAVVEISKGCKLTLKVISSDQAFYYVACKPETSLTEDLTVSIPRLVEMLSN